MERYRFTPVEAKYVRLLCNGNSVNKWNSPTEVRIRFTAPDGIEEVNSEGVNSEESAGPVYDLSGRQIVNSKSLNSKLPRGIYIVNGRKFVVR